MPAGIGIKKTISNRFIFEEIRRSIFSQIPLASPFGKDYYNKEVSLKIGKRSLSKSVL